MKSILVATDGSEHAEKAVKAAAELASAAGAKLTIMNVQDARPLREMVSHFAEIEFAEQLRAHEEGVPAAAVAMYQGLGPRDAVAVFDGQSSMLRQTLSDSILAQSRNQAAKIGARDIAVVSVDGDAAREIISTAHRIGADLIVVGRRGLSGISELVLGSVSQKVLHHAPADVLTVV